MKTVQIVLDEELLGQADREARKAKVTRSELMRDALREYLRQRQMRELEARDRRGYEEHPVAPGEFDAWDQVTSWPRD